MKHRPFTVSLPALFAGVFLAASAASAKTAMPHVPASVPDCRAPYLPVCELERAVDALARQRTGDTRSQAGSDAGWRRKAPRDSGYWLGIPFTLEPFVRDLERVRRSTAGWFPKRAL